MLISAAVSRIGLFFLVVCLLDLISGSSIGRNEVTANLTNDDGSEVSVGNLKVTLQDLKTKRTRPESQGTAKEHEQTKRETIAEVAELIPPEEGTKDAPSIEITYRITKSSQRTPRDVIERTLRKAFDKWEEKADVAFVPKQDGVADLELRFEEGSHDCNQDFDGKGGIAAHAFKTKNGGDRDNPLGGIHFDDGDDWTEESLLRVSAFEIGKLLQILQRKDTEIEEITGTDSFGSGIPSSGLQGQNPMYNPEFPYQGGQSNSEYAGGSFGYGPGTSFGPSFGAYNNYYPPGPYYGGPGFGGGPYGFGPGYGYGRPLIEVDTFYWSNYGATTGFGLNAYDVGRVQGIFGAPNRAWLRNRHRYRERFGSHYSAGVGAGLRHQLYRNTHPYRHNLTPVRNHIGISNRHVNLNAAPGLGLRSGFHGAGFGLGPGLRAGGLHEGLIGQGFSGGHGGMPGFGGRHGGGGHRGGGHRG